MILVGLLIFVVSLAHGYETIDYETAKNLTADYCYVKNYNEIDSIVKTCRYIVIEGFEVPAGKTLNLKLQKKAVLLFEGTLSFGVAHWDGPFISISGYEIQVMGGTNHLIHGHGEKYWDGHGDGGVKKPRKVMTINAHGGLSALEL